MKCRAAPYKAGKTQSFTQQDYIVSKASISSVRRASMNIALSPEPSGRTRKSLYATTTELEKIENANISYVWCTYSAEERCTSSPWEARYETRRLPVVTICGPTHPINKQTKAAIAVVRKKHNRSEDCNVARSVCG